MSSPSGATYGLMFHHFFDEKHPRGQGALSADGFRAIIEHIGRRNILGAEEWLDLSTRGALEPGQTCLTFDDGLRCQYDVALPIMEELGLTGFWFVYSSAMEEKDGPLEVYRYFRTVCFPSVDDFYSEFFRHLEATGLGGDFGRGVADFDVSGFLAEYTLYSRNDRLFRYFRDIVLGETGYRQAMDSMILAHGLDLEKIAPLLWMDNSCLKNLQDRGNHVGLHSYSHPTLIQAMSRESQAKEYRRNFDHLSRVLGAAPKSMSHPCGFYNQDTLAILRDLGITLGFRDNMESAGGTLLEIPRLDHAFLMKEIGIYQQ